jgi:hypothetical protein
MYLSEINVKNILQKYSFKSKVSFCVLALSTSAISVSTPTVTVCRRLENDKAPPFHSFCDSFFEQKTSLRSRNACFHCQHASAPSPGLPDFFLVTTYQNGELCTKVPRNYQIVIQYTKYCKRPENVPTISTTRPSNKYPN